MKLKSLLSFVVCCFVVPAIFAQTINLQVRIVSVERTNYGDCTACGDPDPTWKITATDNGGSPVYGPYQYHYEEDPNLIEPVNTLALNVTNSPATNFTLGMNDAFEKNCSSGNNYTYETYNFLRCIPSVYGDADRCQNPTLAVVNFMDSAPCATHVTTSAWCGNYRFTYSFTWSFNYAPTVVTQPTSIARCDGTAVTLSVAVNTDSHGWTLGQNYQWQVSNNTSCPGSNWTNIAGATASTYSPPTTGGTRLYRCLITSNCAANFATNTVTSACAAVTYNPIGAPGDPVPPIVSGICGSTVLPGSTHILNVLTAPTVGAVVGAAYSWSANGGAPTTGSTASFTWTAPVAPGSYNIDLTYLTACTPNAKAGTCVVVVGSPNCTYAYVSPTGADSVYAGGPDVPFKSVAYALAHMAGRTNLRLAVGVYNESVPLVIQNNYIFDGGYVINSGIWSKVNSDSTVIICTGTQSISASVGHRVGFLSNGASNWELQDLVIRTIDINTKTANGEGYSNYGVLAINNSANFKVIRTKVRAGAAAAGTDGVTPGGSGGAGAGGGGGGGGADATTHGSFGSSGATATGTRGNAGSPGNAGAGGGGGGASCTSSGTNSTGCGSNGCNGIDGTQGSGGSVGSGYVAGARPSSPAANTTYYIPDVQAASGTSGNGGGGGGGGGGGAKGTSCGCTYSGNANGGNGGTGGAGGLPGSGGWGGGGSFAIYASGGGTTGTIITSLAIPGTAGPGGNGANGQPGATGNNGVFTSNAQGSCSDHVQGGNGGQGGDGGNGGRGQDGANGISTDIAAVNGATVIGSSTPVPNNYVVGINYNNAKACIYSEINLTKSSGVWSFPGSLIVENDVRDAPAGSPASSYSAASSPIVVYTTTPSADIDLFVNGLQYASYLKIAPDVRQLPVVTISSHTVCLDGSATLGASHWGTEQEYDWRVYQGANVNSPLYQSTVAAPTVDFTGYAPGLYIVRYKVRENCCGWSIPVYDTIRIVPLPIQYTVQGGGTYCPGGAGVPITLSASEPGVKYVVLYNGVPVDSVIGTGVSPLVFANETQVGIYTIVGYRFSGCGQNMLGFVNVGLSPTPTLFTVTGGGNSCPNATAGPAIYLTGSQLGVTYQLFLNNTTPVGNPVQGTGNQIPFVNAGQPGTYTVEGTFIASPYCSAKMTDSVKITLIALPNAYNVTGGGSYCAGDTGRQIGLSNTDLSVTYSLYTGGVLVAGPIAGTGGPINFGTFSLPGSYNAKATNIAGCDTAMNNSVIINSLPVPQITSVKYSSVSCFAASDDTISVFASSTDGNIHYSIDSGVSYLNTSGLFTSVPVGDYYVVVKDDSGCTARYAANPIVLTKPTSALSVTAQVTDITCSGFDNGSIDLLVSGGWGAYTYSWSTTPVQTVQNITNLSAGTYSATVTDIKGCQVTASGVITNPVALVPTVVATDVTCAGAKNGSAHLTVTGGTRPYSYLWSTFSTAQNLDSLTGGTYYVIITDAKGCVSRDSGIVHEGLPILVSDTFVPISCAGANDASIHVIVSGGSGTYTYTWSPSGPNSADNTNLVPGTYRVTVSDANGCSASTSVVITAPSPLRVSYVVSDPKCYTGTDGSITINASGGTAPYHYQWFPTAADTFYVGNITVGLDSAITDSVIITDSHGCAVKEIITIKQPTIYYISQIHNDVTCHGKNDGSILAIQYGGTPPYSYQWYDGLSSQGNQGPITQNYPQLSGGSYFVVVTDINGCQDSLQQNVREADSLKISLVATDATCQSANSGAVAVIVNGGRAPYTYLWNNFVTDSAQTGLAGGLYGVVVTDSSGCQQSKGTTVNGQPDPMTVNLAINNPTCNGGTNGFVSLDVLGGAQPYTYVWSTTPPQSGNVASNLTDGPVRVTVTDSKGCQLLDSATLTAPPAITVTASIDGATCLNASDGYVVATVSGGTSPFTYQLGNSIQATDTFRNLGVGSYTLIVKDVNGCEGSSSLSVVAPGTFSLDLTATPNYILAGEPVQLLATGLSDTAPAQIRYIWNPLDSLNFQGCADTNNCNDPIATPRYTRTYVVQAINARGCLITDTVLVHVSDHPSAFIPTAFTPNGDGLNDRFEFDILGSVSADVQIYNRWGEKVFSNPNQLNGIKNPLNIANSTSGWDGSFRGKIVQFDSYTYQLTVSYFDGHKESMSGTVVVMK